MQEHCSCDRNIENAEAPGLPFKVVYEFSRTLKVSVVKMRYACNKLGSASTKGFSFLGTDTALCSSMSYFNVLKRVTAYFLT